MELGPDPGSRPCRLCPHPGRCPSQPSPSATRTPVAPASTLCLPAPVQVHLETVILWGIGPACVRGQVQGQCLPLPGSPPPQPAGLGCSAPAGSKASLMTAPRQMPSWHRVLAATCVRLPSGWLLQRPAQASGSGWRGLRVPAWPGSSQPLPRVPQGPGAWYTPPAGASNATHPEGEGGGQGAPGIRDPPRGGEGRSWPPDWSPEPLKGQVGTQCPRVLPVESPGGEGCGVEPRGGP